jgi:hypothetical protein
MRLSLLTHTQSLPYDCSQCYASLCLSLIYNRQTVPRSPPLIRPFLLCALLKVMFWLSGLTCDDTNFIFKAGAQRYLSSQGIAIVCPDTSPRKPLGECATMLIAHRLRMRKRGRERERLRLGRATLGSCASSAIPASEPAHAGQPSLSRAHRPR